MRRGEIDKLITIPGSAFNEFVGELESEAMERVCASLADLLDL